MRLQQVYSMVIHCNISMGFSVYIISERIAILCISRGFCYYWRGVQNKHRCFGLADTTKSGSFPPDLNILGLSVFLTKGEKNEGSLNRLGIRWHTLHLGISVSPRNWWGRTSLMNGNQIGGGSVLKTNWRSRCPRSFASVAANPKVIFWRVFLRPTIGSAFS